MADLALLQASSPLLSVEMASLRLPDSGDFEFSSRRRPEQGSMTASSTETSASRSPTHRMISANNISRRMLGDTGTGLFDLLFDSIKNNASDKPVEDYVGTGVGVATGLNATNGTYYQELIYRHSVTMTAVYITAYIAVFLIGLVGNYLVIAVVFRCPRMRTVTNFFIANLAVADILVIIFCVPATLMSNIYVPWVLGWFLCKLVPYVQGVSVAASVYSLIAVSVDRFLAIWWPMKCQITRSRARLIILVIWVVSLTLTIPWAVFFDLHPLSPDTPHITLCIEQWPNKTMELLYFSIANLLFCYILPTVLISMCYVLIYIKVWKRHIPTDTKDAQMERMQQKSKVKVVKMLVIVVISFVLSWLPLYAIFTRIKLGGELASWEEDVISTLTPFAQWLGSSNSCCNPILYAFFNKKYRRGFVAIWKSRSCFGNLRYYETMAMMSTSSMRKSSYYNNNNSTTRRAPPGQDAVSYITNNAGI